jgi:hypothetical protein
LQGPLVVDVNRHYTQNPIADDRAGGFLVLSPVGVEKVTVMGGGLAGKTW